MVTNSDHFAAHIRLLVIPLLAVLCFTGCYRWTPIEPNYNFGKTSNFSQMRIGGENGEIMEDVKDVSVEGPRLKATKSSGRPLLVDLRLTSVEKGETDPGATTGLVVGITLGGLGVKG